MIPYIARYVGLFCFLALTLSGCGLRAGNIDLQISKAVELKETPFFPQQKYQCGPASLAMLLGSSGVDVQPEELVSKTYVPEKKGSFQVEIMAAARTYGRIPYVLEPQVDSLIEELRAGRPILVLQNYGLETLPYYHYAVVIGVTLEDEIILRSGTQRRHIMELSSFLMSWLRADAWAMVVLRPGGMVEKPDADRYLSAVAAFERVNGGQAAYPAYLAARSSWPNEPLPLFALGNNALNRKSFTDAEGYFRQTLLLNENHVGALNNLADILARKGCYDEATRLIKRAVELADTSSLAVAELVQRTRREILQERTRADSSVTDSCR